MPQVQSRPASSTGRSRRRRSLCLAGYVFVYATRPCRPADPARTVSATTSTCPRGSCFTTPTLAAVARDCCGGDFPAYTAIIRWPGTRRWVNAHPIGVAVMQAPFFAVAHALTRWTNLSPDGFTFYYQHAAGLAGLWWTVAGLVVLGACSFAISAIA